ncbi:MAG: Sua5/YciO/YrdC/YwlC family protein [Gammaproteobacteria bacterium]|nr:Sua5/YciO/YrdC/YwlC family protein [Gammaproteobacteria bacterium]MBU1440815.1 Sua5/YciO/YrdC/YwlC family protein [Gammaproteobacteria bacterium]MBU2285337.1 Sua5/YciO/YrdC/YwlC family protein [Gammaproteobacteria bacterium]
MAVIDHAAQARSAFETMRGGGIAIVPNDVGYAAMASTHGALRRIFDTKGRAPTKLNAMVGHLGLHRRLHRCSSRASEIVDAITRDYDLPLGVIAPADFSDPFLSRLDPRIVEASTREGTLLMLMNAGAFHEELCKLSEQGDVAIFGSSANRSMQGTKFAVADIEPEILAIADRVVDYGILKYKPYGLSSTLLDVENMTIYRRGVAFESIAWILKKHFGIDVPEAH